MKRGVAVEAEGEVASGTARDLGDERGRAVGGGENAEEIDAAFEAVTGIGGDAEFPR